MLDVDRHAEPSSALAHSNEMLIDVQLYEGSDIQTHISSLGSCLVSCSIILCHSEYGAANDVLPARSAMHKHVEADGNFYSRNDKLRLLSWCRLKVVCPQLVGHTLKRMDHFDGLLGVIVPHRPERSISEALP